jgi:L-2-hydroxyglutarate oxidase LhgO
MSETVDCVVVGAGVVGLAVARALALQGREVLLLEAAARPGTQTSARNSGVIHAGMYYATGGYKARFCVDGNRALYQYCQDRGIEHQNCGKLIVANQAEEEAVLQKLLERAAANKVPGMRWLSAAEAHELEPQVRCTAALLSSSTGIVDAHGLMLGLQGDLERSGGTVVCDCPVQSIERHAANFLITTGGDTATTIESRLLVNCAGLGAVQLLQRFADFPRQYIPRLRLARGNYFTLAAKSPFRHLIYPVPQAAGLGIHATLDLGNRVRFGPDVEWVDQVDYSVNMARADTFYAAIRRYWPQLADGALAPDYAGIRPKLHGPNEPQPDFRIDGPSEHGITGLVNLLGIESPGLTSSLAIGKHVASLLSTR